MKKILALFCAAGMLCAVGCGSADTSTSEAETTESVETGEAIEFDEYYKFHALRIPTYSEWDLIDSTTSGFYCQSSGGTFKLTHKSYDTKDLFNFAYNSLQETYHDLSGMEPRKVKTNFKDPLAYSWETEEGYNTIYLMPFDNDIYTITFYVDAEHYRACSMFHNSDELVQCIEYDSTYAVTTAATTTTANPEPNTTEMIDFISENAKSDAATATPEDLQAALDTLRTLSGNFYASNDTMQGVMYNAQLLYYYYENTDTPYEQVGFYAFTAVKYVYRGVDTVDSADTADNLAKFAASLLNCDDIVQIETDPPTEAPTEPPTKSVDTYSAGMYKVGVDIPAGEYCIYCVSDYSGYYCVSADSAGDSIIDNDNFEYNAFVTIYDGQYVEFSRSVAVPVDAIDGVNYKIDTSKTGTFRVGIDIPAGEYKLICCSDYSGYYCVYNSSDPETDIVTNDNFDGQAYITVFDGQYLQLSRCVIE